MPLFSSLASQGSPAECPKCLSKNQVSKVGNLYQGNNQINLCPCDLNGGVSPPPPPRDSFPPENPLYEFEENTYTNLLF